MTVVYVLGFWKQCGTLLVELLSKWGVDAEYIEFLKITRINVTECKLVCPMHSEAKKTETSVWSREKVIAGPSKENG